jgi:cytochrome oxidase Cu insertion factor (SCO1/SenC/PrrC family)
MKRFALFLLAAAALAGCKNDKEVIIKGTFGDMKEGMIYLDQSDVDRSTVIDSIDLKRGHFKFKREITGPEFFQVRLADNEFIGLLAMPGEEITLDLGKSPIAMNYNVAGSPGSEKMKELDQHLFLTRMKLDSLRKAYSELSDADLAAEGPALEKEYTGAVEAQRKYNIAFILDNISSMASIQALYQRIDDNTYVLYQPRDLQFLKIVSDTLSVKYPASRHVKALKENVSSEMNRMYIDRMVSIASQNTVTKSDPVLPDMKGNMVSLSSLRGKYVLVSFWTTTSEECLAQLPELRSVYSLYHRKGLEILQVSLDPDKERWKSVVRFEDLPWINVTEENPQNPVYAISMGIRQVPANLLYDPDGNVINTNLFGRNLQIRMDQLFNK